MGLENVLNGFKRKLITSTLLGSLLIGCSGSQENPTQPRSPPPPTQPPPTQPPLPPPTPTIPQTRVLSSQDASSMSLINGSMVQFSSPMNFNVGDVIGAGITEKTPYGILRQINSASSDKRTFDTSPSSIEQAVKEANLSFYVNLSPSAASASSSLSGISFSMASASSFYDFGVNLNNVVLFDEDGYPNTTSDQVIANGNISFDTDFSLDVDIENFRLKLFEFGTFFRENADINIGSNILGLASTKEIKIAEYKFNPFIIGYLPTPIPLPIIVTPNLGIYINIDPTNINPLSLRMTQESALNSKITYRDGWSKSNSFLNNFNFSVPNPGSGVNLNVRSGPRLNFLLYEIAGPYASINGKLRFDSQNQIWKLYGGLEAVLGVEMRLFGRNIASYAEKVFELETLLAQGGITPPPPQPAEKIFFASTRDGNAEIYSMNTDGSQQRNLTNNSSAWDVTPSLSPDGTKILFSSLPFPTDDHDIYIMNADGSNKTRLTTGSMNETSPVFSPDGSKIAYNASFAASYDQILIMNLNGSNPTNITNDNNHDYSNLAWFPGSKIAFTSNRDGDQNGEIYTMDGNGANLIRLTNNPSYDDYPSWSPDGSKIAFASKRSGNLEIYVMNADGSNLINVSNSPGTEDFNPSWSPNGTKLVYVSGFSGLNTSSEIWIMNANGANKIRLTNNAYLDSSPVWSPR